MTEPIWQRSAADVAAAVRRRDVPAVEVAEDALARLRAVNPALNAVTRETAAEALAAARAVDAALAQGIDPGPLAGVPVTVKDNVDVKGQATPNGVAAFADVIAPEDSPVVRNLRRAGAVIVGRTNTPELSLRAFTDNPLFGLTRNPWDAKLNCGGSSGGAGAAVAAGIGAIAHGNDIGGSLRYPAFCCGVATIKPTLGRVPAFNPSAAAERPPAAQLMSVQGPIAREVRDVRIALQAMMQGDPHDPWWTPAPFRGPEIARPIRVALVRSSPTERPLQPPVLTALDRAAAILADAGYAVAEALPPSPERLPQLWLDLMLTEIEHLQRAAFDRIASPDFKRWLETLYGRGRVLSQPEYMLALAERSALLRAWSLFLAQTPLILAPLAADPPLPVNYDVESAETARIVLDTLGYSASINLLGLPAAVVPVLLHEGAPVGVQLIAGRYREDLCLDAAEAIEARIGVMARKLWAREGALA